MSFVFCYFFFYLKSFFFSFVFFYVFHFFCFSNFKGSFFCVCVWGGGGGDRGLGEKRGGSFLRVNSFSTIKQTTKFTSAKILKTV